MILSDEVIKDGLNYHNHWISLSKEILAKSHLEANARIRELEAKLRELVESVEERDRIENLEEPDYFPDPEKRYTFQDTKYRAWERYKAALKAAKER